MASYESSRILLYIDENNDDHSSATELSTNTFTRYR
jgi:hypothetical protein